MHVEISRLITAWLNHKDFGVNKQLEFVPRAKFGTGTDSAPGKVKIYNDVETYDPEIAGVSGINPPTMPSLVVVSDIAVRTGDTVQQKKAALSYPAVVGIGYYEEEAGNKAQVVRNGNYVMRAVIWSLWEYNESSERSKDYRELNGIRITNMSNITEERVAGAVPTSRLLGMVFADLLVMDKGAPAP